jgi:hypothetical protein
MSSATEAAPASDRRKLPAPGTATLSRRHELRNLKSKVPEDQWPEFKARAIACYHAASPALARMLRDDIAVTHGTAPCPSGLTCLQDDFEACIAHCARYCTLKLVCPARLGLDHEGHRVCTPVGVSSIRASTIRAMAIMTNAVETNRILGSPLKLIYYTSFSHELY